jgi:DNA-binding CsgD family transcriptional regulator
LTPREWEVLVLLEEGLTNEQIAERLDINVGTAKYHVGEILAKLDVESRHEAPAAARTRRPNAQPAGVLGMLRLKTWWPVASAVGVLLILILAGLLVLRPWADDTRPFSIEGAGDTTGLGPDIGASPEAGAAGRPVPPQCVTGPRADNPTVQSPSGTTITMPTNERFPTVEEAEAWICLDVPQADLLHGWRIMGVSAERSHSLSEFVQGLGHRRIDVVYIREPQVLRVELTTPGDFEIVGAGEERKITIGGEPATLWTKDNALTAQWKVNGVPVIALITSGGDRALREAMPLLESIR